MPHVENSRDFRDVQISLLQSIQKSSSATDARASVLALKLLKVYSGTAHVSEEMVKMCFNTQVRFN